MIYVKELLKMDDQFRKDWKYYKVLEPELDKKKLDVWIRARNDINLMNDTDHFPPEEHGVWRVGEDTSPVPDRDITMQERVNMYKICLRKDIIELLRLDIHDSMENISEGVYEIG